MLRTAQLLPLSGLSTLGFDRDRFQSQPPVCYRAPWRLPGPDFHRLVTAGLRLVVYYRAVRPPSFLWAHGAVKE